ncbi:MAG: glycosyl hydrolase [Brumimicrobium sp.]|nr:glycosyl hydrolase [Brumimicrobium sp.]
MKPYVIFALILTSILGSNVFCQKEDVKKDDKNIYSGLKFRSIGPAFMSGRVADIQINPENENEWFVAVGSGGVWKTSNAGTTWESIFDGQKSYSIGCITLDHSNPNTVWVGTGENVGGRHIGYGDGVYVSHDGGKTWENKGLTKSEHISKIVIHPGNSNVIWVAAQGPLWSKGGERGVYKTEDGGKSWKESLIIDEWTGATDLLIDPRNPDVLYAATWQRHRTVAGYMGGGPGSGIYKSTDGGKTWNKLSNGLPSSNLGKIGLAISPQQPDVLYAAIELDRRTGGLYRSEDQGASWKKMSDAISGGTGPHYYQELYASPYQFDKIFFADNYMQISEDGGKTFKRMNEENKHVDNHAVAFKMNDPHYVLVGCDGGLYQSFDNTKTWNFIDNLPVTQFYKIAVDDEKPFYNVYGGTQDNNSQGGPSRTDNIHGIRNSDWFVVLFGDGHQPATEPGNPNIVYAQWQQGNLVRHDRTTGEIVYIQPQPELGEKTERFNWDSPVIVSPHKPTRLYFASQRVWKSEDRGDSWTAVSGDLTKNIERISTPFFEKQQAWDNPWDLYAMSNYSTITSLSESPVKEGLIYAGTDDGIIQVTENGGSSWTKITFDKIPGLPKTAFVNDLKADLYDENTVYAVFDNHKFGDFNPYIYKSTDKGKTWKSLVNNLPGRTLLWRVVQDHVKPELLFLGTEFGVYFSNDGGMKWTQLKNGLPNISVRDLAIQKRENDLVAGTFGRGIYILDDYSPLRVMAQTEQNKEAVLFKPRDGYWYIQRRPLGGGKKASQGDDFFVADNPPFGVEFTYYLKEKYLSKEGVRKEKEAKMIKENQQVKVPDWEELEKEKLEASPQVWLFIFDNDKIIKKIAATNASGTSRVAWDLSTESTDVIDPNKIKEKSEGSMVAPGIYEAQLYKQIEGSFNAIGEKVRFEILPLKEGYPEGAANTVVASFWKEVEQTSSHASAVFKEITKTGDQLAALKESYERANVLDTLIESKMNKAQKKLFEIKKGFSGSPVREEVGEKNEYPTVWDYLSAASTGTSYSTYGPTVTHEKSLLYAQKMIEQTELDLLIIQQELEQLKTEMIKIGGPKISR